MTKSSLQATFYPESTFGGFSDIDGTIAFYARVNALIQPSFRIVDFGCGRGAQSEDPIIYRRELRCIKGKVARIIGLDVDSKACYNPTLDEFRLLRNGSWPLENKSADLVICDNVLEHVCYPETFFGEAGRVLVQGGYLCIRTPNALGYVGIAARLIPNSCHKSLLAKTQPDREDEDIFPTLYRCNTVWAIRKRMAISGFRAAVYGYEPEPSYLNFSKFAYGFGVLHQRFAPSFLKQAIFGFGQLL